MVIIKKDNYTAFTAVVISIAMVLVIFVLVRAKQAAVQKAKYTALQKKVNEQIISLEDKERTIKQLQEIVAEQQLKNQSLRAELENVAALKEKLTNQAVLVEDLQQKISQYETDIGDLKTELELAREKILNLSGKKRQK